MGEEDSNHEVTPKEPELESDKSEIIEQATRPRRNRRPKQIFTYLHIIPLKNHDTITHNFLIILNAISVTSVQYFYHT